MSDAVSTSPASPPSAEPTWLATIAPVAWLSIPRIGPAIARASSGSALPSAWVAWAATGSTSTFQTSVVPTIHSARDQAAVVVTPEGNAVAESSQWSASRTASATADFCLSVTLGSGAWAACLRAMSIATSQLTGPSWGFISDWIWEKSAPRSGIAPAPPAAGVPPNRALRSGSPWPPWPEKNASKGVPLKGFDWLTARRRCRRRARRSEGCPGCRSWLQTTRVTKGRVATWTLRSPRR